MGCDMECGEDEQLCDAGYEFDGDFSVFGHSVQGNNRSIMKAQVAPCQWNASQPKAATTTRTP